MHFEVIMSRATPAANAPLITPREAAGRLGVSYQTIKQWIYQGAVRTTQTAGGHHRVSLAEVDRLLARRNEPATDRRRRKPPVRGALVAISGRNQLAGYVEEVRLDRLLAQVRLRIGDQTLTAVITRDAVDELKLKRGDSALAIVKSTEVMIARSSLDPLE
jgi:molybdopterin-binding protein